MPGLGEMGDEQPQQPWAEPYAMAQNTNASHSVSAGGLAY